MDLPIGLFDSGFGGLTVMREITRLLPHENLIYLADTASLPLGNKPADAIRQFALNNAKFLLKKNIKLLIVPCHTACSYALEILERTLPIPVFGVIQPSLDLLSNHSRIAILATSSTIESQIYQSRIQKRYPQAKILTTACPLFVPLIEEGLTNHPAAHLIAENYLQPLHGKIDAALLACTHYPLMKASFEKILGPNVQILDPAALCANHLKQYLIQEKSLNLQTTSPSYKFFVSENPEKFRLFGENFLGNRMENIEKK